MVDPLLLTFDFTGVCARSTDSNGYSIRVAGQDLGTQYRLRVENRSNELVLVATSNTDRNAAPIEIGRTNGMSTNGTMQITLDSGWRLTRRVFQGKALGHLYLTNDQTLATLVTAATAARTNATTTRTQSTPARAAGAAPRSTPSSATSSIAPNAPVPTVADNHSTPSQPTAPRRRRR